MATTNDVLRIKEQAGVKAAALVQSGMVVGLGTGSTAIFATRAIAERLRLGELRDIVGIARARPMLRRACSISRC